MCRELQPAALTHNKMRTWLLARRAAAGHTRLLLQPLLGARLRAGPLGAVLIMREHSRARVLRQGLQQRCHQLLAEGRVACVRRQRVLLA